MPKQIDELTPEEAKNAPPPFPEDLLKAYQTFTMLCAHYGIFYTALAMRENPYGLYVIGNLSDSGHQLASLLREQAAMIDLKASSDLIVETPVVPKGQLN